MRLEKSSLFLWWDAHTIIDNFDSNPDMGLRFLEDVTFDFYLWVSIREFDGVRNKVYQDLVDSHLVNDVESFVALIDTSYDYTHLAKPSLTNHYLYWLEY